MNGDTSYPQRLLLTVIAAIVVFTSSMTIVSASLPTMAEALDSTESLLSWAVTGLFLVMAVCTPTFGRLGDIHGHRTVFLAGAATLSLATVAAAAAPSAEAFVGARMLAGLGIAATMPTAMALIMEAYPVDRRAEAMGWFSAAMTGAPVVGLVVGGPLIEAFGWRSVFIVLAPISLLGLAAAWRVIQPSPRADPSPIDWAGAATLAVGTVGALLFLQFGGTSGFGSPLALVMAVAGVFGLATFVVVERRAPAPMLRLDYFRRPNFRGPLIAQPTAQFAYMGSFVISPLLLDDLFGYSVSVVALILLFRPGTYSITSPLGGRLAGRFGERLMVVLGTVLMVASMLAWVGGALWTNVPLILVGLVLSGLAMGLATPAYATVLAGSVDEADLGVANGMGTTMMNIGMLTGIQSLFTILGDGREPRDFAIVFAVAGAVAAIGLIGGVMIQRQPASATPSALDVAVSLVAEEPRA
ncbi:MAG: MFS transporter [Actinomycetota bacterium]